MGQLHDPRTQIHEVGLCVTYIYDLYWFFGVGGIQTQIPSSTTQGIISLINCNPDKKKKR